MKNKIHKLKKEQKGDKLIIVAIILLSIIGLVFIYSSSNYSAFSTYNDKFYFVKKQFLGILIGIVAMFFFCNFDYEKLKKYLPIVTLVTFISLILVFIPVIGVENYGAKRWINLGFFTLQPSELAKFNLILFTATYFSNNPLRTKSFLGILPVLCVGGLTLLLIILEPNMSITICVALLLFSLLFLSGVSIKILIFLIIPCIIGAIILIIIEPYRLLRLNAFINPWSNPKGEGYQLLQSLYALGSGGLFGVGIFNSRQKYAFLPFSESDFILSVIGEETGFFGTAIILSIFLFIVIRGFIIAKKSKDFFGYILAVGISMILFIQVIINGLVVSGSIPPTGLPLPLISSGNTAIIVFMIEGGVLYNVSKG